MVAADPLHKTVGGRRRHGAAKARGARRVASHVQLCAFCLGSAEQNRVTGKPEPLVCCSECGSCGHPTCMHWGTNGRKLAIAQQYAWRCMECKVCEVCDDKGDDSQIMFCDRCDRGWHLYCLDPPLSKPPRGVWYCPRCAPSPPVAAAPERKTVVRLRRGRPAKRARQDAVHEDAAPAPASDDHFAGVLVVEDAETRGNEPGPEDVERFERSRRAAESRLGAVLEEPARDGRRSARPASVLSDETLSARASPMSTTSESGQATAATAAESGQATPVRMIRFGAFDIDTWFYAPFPEEYSLVPDGRLWVCEFCFKYMKSRFMAHRHRLKCRLRYPPGDEIYREGGISVFEIDGRKNKIYCQNLCLLAKLFLDHKTLYYDVEPFLFYVFVETDATGAHFVGYFSKEKRSPLDYNVSCIMTLPIHQRRGWGYYLIEMSYLLSKREGRLGSPEKPLSDLGFLTYRSYWTLAVYRALLAAGNGPYTVEALCDATAMKPDDVLYTLKDRGLLQTFHNGTDHARLPDVYFTLGERNAEEPPPPPPPGELRPNDYRIEFARPDIAAYVAQHDAKSYVRVVPERLQWTPFLLSRGAPASAVPAESAECAAEAGTKTAAEKPKAQAEVHTEA